MIGKLLGHGDIEAPHVALCAATSRYSRIAPKCSAQLRVPRAGARGGPAGVNGGAKLYRGDGRKAPSKRVVISRR